ncbi:MAG TPA: hypothetical protein VFS00_22960, partial [Polyangiaceae bacterium]|nr:hypothetical protein [Polyangiaceae bacterium]
MALTLAVTWVGCGEDDEGRCDEARGYVFQQGASGLGGMAGAPEMGTGGGLLMGAAGAGMGGMGAGGSGGVVCGAPQVDCGGTCVDVKADNAANCGACGRACLGAATCAAGACVPEAMATGEVAPYALVEDGANLYWVSPAVKEGAFNPRVRRVTKASAGGATDVFTSTDVRARSLGFDGTKIYWGDLGANPSDTANQRLLSAAPSDPGAQPVAS